MLVSLDIETACNVANCQEKRCDHALTPHTAKITCVGMYYELAGKPVAKVFRCLGELHAYLNLLEDKDIKLVGHNFKFDLKHLYYNDCNIPLGLWKLDTQILADACFDKVPEEYLQSYEQRRLLENKKLPRGYSHRKAGPLSLKVLAPYFLKVDPFWEDPTNHDNDEYVIKDCKYTYHLAKLLYQKCIGNNVIKFVEEKLMPYTKMLLLAECKGILLDLEKLEKQEMLALDKRRQLKNELDHRWIPVYEKYLQKQIAQLIVKYAGMRVAALDRLKSKDSEKAGKIKTRYGKLLNKAVERLPSKMNLDSPKQLAWIFKDYLKLNIKNLEGKDSTDATTLQKLSLNGSDDAKLFLEYRRWNKLATAFYPAYNQLHNHGVVHCNFNPTGTRTGRLSSNEPNLQQVPADVHSLFIARPGYKLATFDMRSIETVLIAYYSKDPILIDIVKQNIKFHGYNAKIYFPEINCDANEVKDNYPEHYSFAKELGYALFYGAGAGRIEATAKKRGYDWPSHKCKELKDNFKETYRQVFEFKRKLDTQALSHPIINLLGRTHVYPDPTEIYMKTFNTLIQSSASDMVLNSAYRISQQFQKRNLDGHVLLLVHDEIVTEIPENKQNECVEIIKTSMTDYKLETPLDMIPLEVDGQVSYCWEK